MRRSRLDFVTFRTRQHRIKLSLIATKLEQIKELLWTNGSKSAWL